MMSLVSQPLVGAASAGQTLGGKKTEAETLKRIDLESGGLPFYKMEVFPAAQMSVFNHDNNECMYMIVYVYTYMYTSIYTKTV